MSPNAASSVMFVAVHGRQVPLFVAKCHKVEAASCSLDPGAASVLHSPRAAPRRRSPVPAHVTSAVIAGGGQAVTTGGATRTTKERGCQRVCDQRRRRRGHELWRRTNAEEDKRGGDVRVWWAWWRWARVADRRRASCRPAARNRPLPPSNSVSSLIIVIFTQGSSSLTTTSLSNR